MSRPSKIAAELEERERRMQAEAEEAEALRGPGKKRRGSGRVKGFFKDQLVRRTSTKR